MTAKWSRARAMLASFCENLASGDELFLVTVGQRPKVQTDYTSDCAELQNGLLLTQPHGATALLDAIPLAVQHLRHARHARHAILIISDGGENASRTRLATIRSMAREANAQIYSATLGLEPAFSHSIGSGETNGPQLLNEIAEFTGGRAFSVLGNIGKGLRQAVEDLDRVIDRGRGGSARAGRHDGFERSRDRGRSQGAGQY
jgi:Ca-activated chloride channel family protein